MFQTFASSTTKPPHILSKHFQVAELVVTKDHAFYVSSTIVCPHSHVKNKPFMSNRSTPVTQNIEHTT